VSDRSGWWQIYGEDGRLVTRDPSLGDAEFGRPQWIFGTATWGFADPETMVVACTRGGRWQLGALDVSSGRMRPLAPGIEPGEWLSVNDSTCMIVGGSPSTAPAVAAIDVATGTATVLRSSASQAFDPGYLSEPEAIECPTGDGLSAHAFYYPPRHAEIGAPPGEAPPLIVISHGGPTTAAKTMMDVQIQFWTSRGIGVLDVNYGGSSGYGRAYRQRLNGQWGIVDVADCVNAARHLVALGKADGGRLAIRGGSAGGYTTLAALTFHPGVFGAGASYYGISDIEVLAHDTHKFESRYLDSLVGPYPEARDVYRARSPIHFVDRLACPLILLQGLEDKVVPPNQARMMADAVRAKGLPVALLMFEGEQHGFRRADTIIRSLEAELYFYGVVFGFTPADRIEPVPLGAP
jgi:dipeptidyl aminopeptidase/acylaminoacyl peptidase